MQQAAILSLGSINADFQAQVDAGADDAELRLARCFRRLSGGKAANVAFIARRLGAPAWLIGHVGADDLAAQALGGLQAAGVDLSRVVRLPDAGTAVSMIVTPPGGDKRIILAANANDSWTPAQTSRAAAAIAEAPEGSVLVADYEVPADVVTAAVGAASARGLPVVIDPSPPQRAVDEDLARAAALAPNAEEAGVLAGLEVESLSAAARAARRLAATGAEVVCVKLADGGALLAHDGGLALVPAAQVEVVDKTGAGDAFTGALAVALLEGRAPLDAALLATAAANLAVTAFGSQPSYAPRETTEELAGRLRAGVRPLCVP